MPFRQGKYLPHIHTGEMVHLILRQHWLMPVLKALFWVFLIVLILVGDNLLKSFFEISPEAQSGRVIDVLTSIFLIIASLGLLIVWTMFYLNVQLVTNHRIIDINQKSITHHETTEIDLNNVQDVTTEIKGVIANIFNYGNVQVQTAGTEQNFIFDHIPAPHQTAKTVITLSGRKGGKTKPQESSPERKGPA